MSLSIIVFSPKKHYFNVYMFIIALNCNFCGKNGQWDNYVCNYIKILQILLYFSCCNQNCLNNYDKKFAFIMFIIGIVRFYYKNTFSSLICPYSFIIDFITFIVMSQKAFYIFILIPLCS